MADEDETFQQMQARLDVSMLMTELDMLMDMWRQRDADPMATISTACAYLLAFPADVLSDEDFKLFVSKIQECAIKAKEYTNDRLRPVH